ncbi:MAG: serine/threonine protein kinase [Gammaproteobacteria bacterium]|nr:serine/threonine protein kinase [Gammaproteobacteria bacterium]
MFKLIANVVASVRGHHKSSIDAQSKRRIHIVIGIAVLLMAAIGAGVHYAIKRTLTDSLVEGLETVLEADVEALRIWMRKKRLLAQSFSRDPRMQLLVQQLIAARDGSDNPRQGVLEAPQLKMLRDLYYSMLYSSESSFFVIVDREGVIATDQDDIIGKGLTSRGVLLIAQSFQEGLHFLKPQFEGTLLREYQTSSDRYWIGFMVPMQSDKGEIIATLILAMRPEEDFSRILSIARMGESGDTYAFDEDGVMLSDTRHTEQLKKIDLLPDDPQARSILRVQIRDPGGDLTQGYRSKMPVQAWPLTQLVAITVANKQGTQYLVEPYRDYRGVQVVGASQWLPEYGFGIATEAEIGEMLSPLNPLKFVSYTLFAILFMLALLIVYYSVVIHSLRRRDQQVRQLGQYSSLKLIGEGGMGKVYLAKHAFLKRLTAVKYLPMDRVKHETVTRFEREVQLTSKLTDPNTVQIYDYGRTPEGIFYYAMEYLPGITLTRLLEIESAVPPARVIYILRQICSSLEEAHTVGLIHRDIKPLNIMLCRWGIRADVVKVLDFGLVKDVSQTKNPQLTSEQVILGTPGYYAPERLTDPKNIDSRVDLFGLGIVAYNLLTGKDVFEEEDTAQTLLKVIEMQPQYPSLLVEHEVPQQLDQLVMDCLAKDPDDRPQGMGDVKQRLNDIESQLIPWNQEDARGWWDVHKSEIDVQHNKNSSNAF